MQRWLRRLLLAVVLLAAPAALAPQAEAGMILFTHRYVGGQWWTDMWNVEFPGIWTHLGTSQGYF